jgi:hypothetical protein
MEFLDGSLKQPTQSSDSPIPLSVEFLAIDPGETTGWATFTQRGELVGFGQLSGVDDFTVWLEAQKCSLLIFEDYLINPNVPHGGSRVETIQVIGSIRSFVKRRSICVVPQSPSIKRIGYAWCRLKPLPKSKHKMSHQFDALAHGIYYLCRNRIRPIGLGVKVICDSCKAGTHDECRGCTCQHRPPRVVVSRAEDVSDDRGRADAVATEERSREATGPAS